MYKYIFLFVLCCSFFQLSAQTTLDVWGVSQWPDTSTLGATVGFDVILENNNATIYNDSIDLHFFVDSGSGLVIADTVSLGTQMIPALDTSSFFVFHLINSLKYAPGNNVVVIWPISGSGGIGDSIILDIYILGPNSLKEVGQNKLLTVFPNPSCKFLFVSGLELDGALSYSVHSAEGSLIQKGRVTKSGRIDIEKLQKGVYVLSLQNGLFEKGVRFIKN